MTSRKRSEVGELHDTAPGTFAVHQPEYDQPFYWGDRSRTAPPEGCRIEAEFCVLDNEDYFVRADLAIPVHGSAEPLVFVVWAAVSKANFERERQMAKDPAGAEALPYFGWLANQLAPYAHTLNLRCRLRSRGSGLRPALEITTVGHPLAIDQRDGISQERMAEILASSIR